MAKRASRMRRLAERAGFKALYLTNLIVWGISLKRPTRLSVVANTLSTCLNGVWTGQYRVVVPIRMVFEIARWSGSVTQWPMGVIERERSHE